jgi:serine/threonine protein kinase
VHRDIKPANIYLCRRGLEHDVVKVLDFGLATAFAGAGAPAPGAVIGTPAYMAPETTDVAARLDGRTDLYAVGCVAYWLLTGRVVFPRDTVGELLEAHRSAQPLAPSAIAPSTVPAALDGLVLHCLEKSRDNRPASAEAVAATLESIAETLPWRPVGH